MRWLVCCLLLASVCWGQQEPRLYKVENVRYVSGSHNLFRAGNLYFETSACVALPLLEPAILEWHGSAIGSYLIFKDGEKCLIMDAWVREEWAGPSR